jgi:hypothetical protein
MTWTSSKGKMSIIDSVPVLDAAISMSAVVAISLTWEGLYRYRHGSWIVHGTFWRRSIGTT